MQYTMFRADERGTKDIGWLKSKFSFSFSSYANPLRNGFGLLRVFNDDVVSPGTGFGLHPHQNMEIISIMLQGSMSHKDSMGYQETVHRDWVQIMSAGSGLRHEEYNVGEEDVQFLQIWIEPKLQNINPRYQRRRFDEASRINQLTTVVSHEEGQAHCWINQQARISLGYYQEATSVPYHFNPTNKGVFIFSISGSLAVAGQTVPERDAIGVWNTDSVLLEPSAGSRFIVIEVPINH